MRRYRQVVWAAILLCLAAEPTAGQAPLVDATVSKMVTGVISGSGVVAGGVPLKSGSWGTDYITVSHALQVGASYSVIREGHPFADTKPVAACSSQAHRIDVLILRAATHPRAPVVEWGDPTGLQGGDELLTLPRREIHPGAERLKFVHVNLLEWSKASWPPQWRDVMVASGLSKPGFSGSPWVKDGKVYGLHKGQVRPANQQHWYPVAETAARVKECLDTVGYQHLVPPD